MIPCGTCGGWAGRHDPSVHGTGPYAAEPDHAPGVGVCCRTVGACPVQCHDCPLPRDPQETPR